MPTPMMRPSCCNPGKLMSHKPRNVAVVVTAPRKMLTPVPPIRAMASRGVRPCASASRYATNSSTSPSSPNPNSMADAPVAAAESCTPIHWQSASVTIVASTTGTLPTSTTHTFRNAM
jgi:hypothetical protein